jgi:DNA repair protein RadC
MNKLIPRYRTQLIRESSETMYDVDQIDSPSSAMKVFAELLQRAYGADVQESLHVAFLNTKNRVTGFQQVATGGINTTVISIADIFRGAIVAGAPSIILSHNHPSQEHKINPSPEDLEITRKVVTASNLLGIKVMDHIIFNSTQFYSMKENMAGIFYD